jgi:hypothetical protein
VKWPDKPGCEVSDGILKTAAFNGENSIKHFNDTIQSMLAYALTIFLGAFLLFQVQPLIGKYLLPWFGGGPSVWTTCLFFFQAFLLTGYVYAHALTRYCKSRAQTTIHLALLVASLASLPIVPSEAWKPRTSDHPFISILLLLAANLGLPYLVLSSTGPLLQHWSTGLGKSPYGLYALSNLGSLLALVTYPVIFEAHLSRRSQASLWAWGLLLYGLCCGICAIYALRSRPDHRDTLQDPGEFPSSSFSDQTVALSARRVWWLLWPACASVLLLSTTNKLCLDVAVFPLLWVLPLGLYLLSFIICFAAPNWYLRLPFTFVLVAALAGLCCGLFRGAGWPFWKQVSVYTGALFVCCMVCHGELFRIRPAPGRLTEFYLLVALGGALGGLFVSLIAPSIFSNYYELHWGLVLLGVLVVIVRSKEGIRVLLSSQSDLSLGSAKPNSTTSSRVIRESVRFGLAILWLSFFALTTALWLQARRPGTEIVHKSRNFYGVVTVFEHRKDEWNGHHFLLQHGRITHGFQFADRRLQTWPTTYYGPDSGLGLALNALASGERRVGVVGLGTGTIAAYARPGDYFRFYEINPQVSCLATSRFTYLANCHAKWEVTLGDARLALEKQPPQQFDVLALDAFNSDSIPVHLLTREAFEVYLRHLKPNGILAVHISNHFLKLEPVVAGLARHFSLETALVDHDAKPEQWWIYSSTWMLLARDRQVLDVPSIRSATKTESAHNDSTLLWTDDFSSLFRILR